MLLLQTFPTIGVSILSLVGGVLLARGIIAGHRSKPLLLLFALLISVGFGYLWLLPAPLALPAFAGHVARALSIPAVGLCWWFAWSLLDDRFRIGGLQWFGLIAASVFPTYYFLHSLGAAGQPWPKFILDFGSVPPLALCVHMLWMALQAFATTCWRGGGVFGSGLLRCSLSPLSHHCWRKKSRTWQWAMLCVLHSRFVRLYWGSFGW